MVESNKKIKKFKHMRGRIILSYLKQKKKVIF